MRCSLDVLIIGEDSGAMCPVRAHEVRLQFKIKMNYILNFIPYIPYIKLKSIPTNDFA